jgi:hypothetical protein
MEKYFYFWVMGIRIDMIDSLRVKSTGPADEPMNFIPFGKQELCQITPILARNPGD